MPRESISPPVESTELKQSISNLDHTHLRDVLSFGVGVSRLARLLEGYPIQVSKGNYIFELKLQQQDSAESQLHVTFLDEKSHTVEDPAFRQRKAIEMLIQIKGHDWEKAYDRIAQHQTGLTVNPPLSILERLFSRFLDTQQKLRTGAELHKDEVENIRQGIESEGREIIATRRSNT